MTLNKTTSQIPCATRQDYAERVYAGVLGKIIGVYLGRPFEQWRWDRIERELGEIWYYVHERLNVPLIVTDDDISGTFTFLRALADHGYSRGLTSAQIGQTWLNYIIERRTILWWGGVGNSTEHTAYQRLKRGIPAPASGSIALNGTTVAEQIGAQIFIDGWGLVAPGDPELAADFARRAGSVSHDGEAVYGAQVIAALVAAAFDESDIHRLLDTAVRFIPANSQIARLIAHMRDFHAANPDWRAARDLIYDVYSYERYPGNCHIIPNHALVIVALLYGDDDFQKSQMIVNTCGYDTDCNAANVGCILGVKNGLKGLDVGPDWRGPVADRLYLSTADGGRGITDAVNETFHIVNAARILAGEAPLTPKQGARWHFELPGSVQGFMADDAPDARGLLRLENVVGHSASGMRSLALHYHSLAPGRTARAKVATFIQPDALTMPGYELFASPLLYAGQALRIRLSASSSNPLPVSVRLMADVYTGYDQLTRLAGPTQLLMPGAACELTWQLPQTDGQPIAGFGIEIMSTTPTTGTIYFDWARIDGTPQVTFTRPTGLDYARDMPVEQAWRRAWVNALDHWEPYWSTPFHIAHNEGRGLLSTGTSDWRDYVVSARMSTDFAAAVGIAARVQGLRRYYAALLRSSGHVQIVRMFDEETVLADAQFDWQPSRAYDLSLTVQGARLEMRLDGVLVLTAEDSHLANGGIALVCEEGFLKANAVSVASNRPSRID